MLCRTPEDIQDVQREVEIMHHLAGHANITRLKGSYEDKGNVHLVMELCSGGELFDRIVQRGHYTYVPSSTNLFASVQVLVSKGAAMHHFSI